MKYPDYDRSLLSLAASVLKHFDRPTEHATLPELDEMLEKNYKNVVLMLFDGMGVSTLEKHLPEDSFLRRNMRCTISSVFPATTTAATVSVETGMSPIEHGWLGWSLYFGELDENVSLFPNTISGTGGRPAADYNVARRFLPYEDIFDKVYCAVRVSPFSSFKSKSVDDICDTVKDLCQKPGRKYIYTYWNQPDYDMHDLGTADERITALMREINSRVEAMASGLRDTLLIVTADHGLTDTEWLPLSDCPDIEKCLDRTPSVEARAMTFFVKPGMCDEFREAFERRFGGVYTLYDRQAVFDAGLFGRGTPNPRVEGFIGDFLAVADGRVSIELAPPEQRSNFKAAHAGMTEEEMNIPFIALGL